MDISGTAALVTGASRGLGEALALSLAEQGARVVLVSRARQALEPIVRRIRERGGEAHALEADLGSKDDVYPLAGAATALVGPIDLLIHNGERAGADAAAALARYRSAEDLPSACWPSICSARFD